ncbi:MAG: cation transporter [Alphaproteobacteria bacterium]|nr:cation transporter [Alphaproteobacteria bacterium]
MKKLFLVIALWAASSNSVWAEEVEVTLQVDNMFCATCPFIVKSALEEVEGVVSVHVEEDDQIAVVVYDDKVAAIQKLEAATTLRGYPSKAIK